MLHVVQAPSRIERFLDLKINWWMWLIVLTFYDRFHNNVKNTWVEIRCALLTKIAFYVLWSIWTIYKSMEGILLMLCTWKKMHKMCYFIKSALNKLYVMALGWYASKVIRSIDIYYNKYFFIPRITFVSSSTCFLLFILGNANFQSSSIVYGNVKIIK